MDLDSVVDIVVIRGDSYSGKTHLMKEFAAKSGGKVKYYSNEDISVYITKCIWTNTNNLLEDYDWILIDDFDLVFDKKTGTQDFIFKENLANTNVMISTIKHYEDLIISDYLKKRINATGVIVDLGKSYKEYKNVSN